MNYEEIHAAATELCAISKLSPEQISWAEVNKQMRRIVNAGLPINTDPELRPFRDRAYERLTHLCQWPMSDSAERAEYVRESARYFAAIASEAGLRDPQG